MQGSYQFETLIDRHKEGDFLAERAQMRLNGFNELLQRHGLPKSGTVLEVGCAQGIRTKIMARANPNLEVIGMDRSAELLPQTSGGIPNLRFLEGDLYQAPFPENSFDFIYARLVFMHLKDPVAALTSLQKILKPGGRILIEDADRDCMFFEPAPNTFAPFWKKIQSAQRALGGDPNVGRKLVPYLKEVGLESVQSEVQPIFGHGSEIDFLVRTLLPSLNLYLTPELRAEGNEAIYDLAALAKDPRATFHHFWFVASGRKP